MPASGQAGREGIGTRAAHRLPRTALKATGMDTATAAEPARIQASAGTRPGRGGQAVKHGAHTYPESCVVPWPGCCII